MGFADTLKSKDFILIAEMETPKGVDLSGFVANANRIKGRIDAVLIPDLSHAVMRLSALGGAVALKQQGLEPIVQFSCRDRNRLALQGDLLAAHVLGVANVMATVGEPIEMGDHLEAKLVADLTPAQFLAAARSLGQGKDLAGMELNGAPSFCAGARIEPWVDDAEAQVRIGEAKAAVDSGAAFLVTPPVFDPAALGAFLQKAGDLGAPVIASVLLLKSVGMARYINQNLPGMNIGEETIIRIRQASDRPGECVKIAAETVDGLRPLCGGALLVTTGWEKRLPDILAALKM